jgi:hypothetical protein
MAAGCEEPTALNPTQSGDSALQTTQETTDTLTGAILTGTKWKLVEFVNVSDGTTKIPEPESDQCYWILFDSDTTFSGKTSTNDVVGYYRINLVTSTIYIDDIFGTEINELFDGRLYVEKLHLVCSFEHTETFLKLYYNKTDYLLFNPYDNEN